MAPKPAPKSKGKTPALKQKPSQSISANWAKSTVTTEKLEELAESGVLPPQSEISWRAPEEESRPSPDSGEVVVFLEHVIRGFRPPGHPFFREVLHHYKLRVSDIGPNSILNICHYIVVCESYLCIAPNLALFLELFQCKPCRESTDGPLLVCGGVAIQRRKKSLMPTLNLHTHVKHWQKTFFYCKDTSRPGEKPLPGFSTDTLSLSDNLSAFASEADRETIQPLLHKLAALAAHGLCGLNLIKTWISCRIQPNSIRPKLLCEYSGHLTDSLRYSEKSYPAADVNKAIKNFLAEKVEVIRSISGLSPFTRSNPAPPVRTS